MTQAIFEAVAPVWILSFFLILCRVAAAIFAFPALGTRGTPRQVKIGLSVALAALWFGQYGFSPSPDVVKLATDPNLVAFAIAVAGEIVLGSFLGFAFGLLLLPFRIAGSYIGQEIGLTLGNVTDPTTFSSTNSVGQMFEILALILFFAIDMHHILFGLIHSSFAKSPIGQGLIQLPTAILAPTIGMAHQHGLRLIAPMAIITFGAVVVLMMIAKSAPQLNLFSVGINVRLVVGLLAILFFLPDLVLLGKDVLLQSALSLRQALQV